MIDQAMVMALAAELKNHTGICMHLARFLL
jgi:hypothetical protein